MGVVIDEIAAQIEPLAPAPAAEEAEAPAADAEKQQREWLSLQQRLERRRQRLVAD